jgi:beta-alanine degradation protein BauB
MSTRFGVLLLAAASAFAQRDAVVDNEFVRVLDVTQSGNGKGRPHEHSMNRVMIYLTEGKQRLEYADGTIKVLEFEAGTAVWSPAAGTHTSQNLGAPLRVIEVELKNKPGKPAALALDPVRVAPQNYKVEIDNPQVRVVRAGMRGKQQVPMHEHVPNRVVVFLTDAHLRVTDESGKSTELQAKAGEVRWSGAAKHREENLSEQPFEVIAVELK